jgi:P-type conjugative transfer protein TrbG
MSPISRPALSILLVAALIGASAASSLAAASADKIAPGKPDAAATAPGPYPPAGPAALPAARAAASSPAQARPAAPGHRGSVRRYRRARMNSPLAALDHANSEARDGPASGVFVNSALYHAFEPGRLYAIHTSPRFLTTIALRPGEKLISKAAGDTVRWVLGETEAGAGEAVQVIVFVKPMRAGLRTNIVLTTDQRTYLIDAVSTAAGAYTSVLSWTYPQEDAQARAAAARASGVGEAVTVAPAVPVERLDFRYAVRRTKGRDPAWRPVRVFDDGAKTYIEFPPDLAVREAPPLFVLGEGDVAQLVNYRLLGRYIVVDRLIDRAELRLGDKKPVVVRITRQGVR